MRTSFSLTVPMTLFHKDNPHKGIQNGTAGQILQIKSNFLTERGHGPCSPHSLKAVADFTTFLFKKPPLELLFKLALIFGGGLIDYRGFFEGLYTGSD